MVTPFRDGAVQRRSTIADTVDIHVLTGGGPVLVLTPHPDDETLGAGTAILAARGAGYAVTIACLTDGAASHPGSNSYPAAKLARLRQNELREAAHRLNVASEVVFLGLPDQGAIEALSAENKIRSQLKALIERQNIKSVWTTWEHDPHSDHEAAAALAKEITLVTRTNLWRFPIWGRFVEQDVGPDERVYVFGGSLLRADKRRALDAHRSQMTNLIEDDPSGFVMEEDVQRHFVEAPEIFIGTDPHG